MSQWKAKLRRVGISLAVTATCLYAPFGTILVCCFPRSDWANGLAIWPFAPTILMTSTPRLEDHHLVFYHNNIQHEELILTLTSLVLLVGLSWLGSRGWGWLVLAAAIALAIATPMAFFAAAALAA